ncbi:MAG: sensor histidine kinase [Chloroflexota bacterium]
MSTGSRQVRLAMVAVIEPRRFDEARLLSGEEPRVVSEELETLNEEQQAAVEEIEMTNEELRTRNLDTRSPTDSLEAEHQRLETLLESMSDAAVAIDPAGEVVFSNALFNQTFGPARLDFAPEDSDGSPLPVEERPVARLRRGDTFRMEFTLPSPEGARRWYEATGRPTGDRAEARDAVLVIHDITDRTLRRLQDQFLALAAHELRTPLTAVLGSLQLLIKRSGSLPNTPAMAEPVRIAVDAAHTLKRLIDDLVDIGRLTNGKLRLVAEPVDLAVVARDLVDLLQGMEEEATILLEGADKPLVVRGDTVRLRQVLANMLNNALTHAPGSPIEIRLGREADMAEIRMTDHGTGISPEVLPNLFKRFYQATGADPRHSTGLGLGLYIAREIIEAHGGTIAAVSVVGEGAVFTVRLPLLEQWTERRT